jgi:hypothetical protein
MYKSHFSQSSAALWKPSFRFMGTCQRWQEEQEEERESIQSAADD